MSEAPSHEQGSLLSLNLRLPPLPQTLPDVLELLDQPGLLDARDIAEVVQRDPAVVARLLQRINSAYYGLRRSVTSVERAIRMMGPTASAGTVIGLGMLKLQKLIDGPAGACFSRLVRHSVGTAYLSRYLLRDRPPRRPVPGARTPDSDEDFASNGFTEGLLHDFGKMILVYNFPEEAVALYEERSVGQHLDESDDCALEQLVFGCDHTEAGAYAAAALHFPEPLTYVIRHHHTPEAVAGERGNGAASSVRALRAVTAANRAAKAMGAFYEGTQASAHAIDWTTCADHPVWNPWLDDPDATTDDERCASLMADLHAQEADLARYTEQFLAEPVAPEEA